MKTRIFLMLLLLVAVVFSCQKEKEPVATDQEVTFGATLITDDLKDTKDGIPACVLTATPTNAHILMTGPGGPFTFDPLVFQIAGKWYTQAIKLPVGTYQVTTFFMYVDANANGAYDTGEVIVYATPTAPSTYTIYLTHQLPYTIDVTGFTKVEKDIEVLCFLNLEYENFGFFWFEITEIIIREACFFGDLCITNFELWNYPPYNIGGVMPDEEAQIKIEVYVNGAANPLTTWDNEDTYTNNVPLCVEYPDVVGSTDTYIFKLYVWVPTTVPGIFTWQLYGTFTTTDELPIPEAGDDKVVDFAIGTCSPDSHPEYEWLDFPPASPDFIPFYIRNHDGSIVSPWDTDMNITENAAGDGFSAITPQGGQKVGYGTHLFDGMQINDFQSVNFNKISGKDGIVPYMNFWVTDGTHFAVISSENDYRGTDFTTRQEWKVFEYEVAADLDWLFDSGDGARDGAQYLTRNGVRVTITDFSDNIILADPGAPYPSYVGTGAPRGGFGFQLIFGDTQANYVGNWHLDQLQVTVGGTTYYATNP